MVECGIFESIGWYINGASVLISFLAGVLIGMLTLFGLILGWTWHESHSV